MSTTTAIEAVRWLRRVKAEAIATGTPAMRRLVEVLDRYFEGARGGLTLDRATGVATEQGSSPWYLAEDAAERRRLLSVALDCFPGAASKRAVSMLKALRRYERGPWRRDCKFRTPPPEYSGRVEEHFFFLLKRGGLDGVPGPDTLRKCSNRLKVQADRRTASSRSCVQNIEGE